MIIKVRTTGLNHWRFFDNARAVQTSVVGKEEIPVIDYSGAALVEVGDSYGFEHGGIWEEVLMNSDIPSSECVSLISFMSGHVGTGERINLYTNSTEIYLLSDTGKTIERI